MATQISNESSRIRKEQGDEAAKKYECSQMGAGLGMLSGAMTGAAIGSIIPVVGSFIGLFIGGMWGIMQGLKDETRFDNIKTASGIITAIPKVGKL